jgi:hypothetical protein
MPEIVVVTRVLVVLPERLLTPSRTSYLYLLEIRLRDHARIKQLFLAVVVEFAIVVSDLCTLHSRLGIVQIHQVGYDPHTGDDIAFLHPVAGLNKNLLDDPRHLGLDLDLFPRNHGTRGDRFLNDIRHKWLLRLIDHRFLLRFPVKVEDGAREDGENNDQQGYFENLFHRMDGF